MPFDLDQFYEYPEPEEELKTFKDYAAQDIFSTFLNPKEHGEEHTIDGKKCVIVFEDTRVKKHAAHWEGGAKQNFDIGLYESYGIIYVSAKDYGPRPKVGKLINLDIETDHKRTYVIRDCENEGGLYRIKIDRVRQ